MLRVEAREARGQHAQLQEHDPGTRGEHHGPRGAHHLRRREPGEERGARGAGRGHAVTTDHGGLHEYLLDWRQSEHQVATWSKIESIVRNVPLLNQIFCALWCWLRS